MNLDALYDKLMAAARADHPAQTVPYAFEQRILARLTSSTATDPWLSWAKLLRPAAAVSVGLALVVSSLTVIGLGDNDTSLASLSYGQDFESTLLVAADVLSDSW
jgi:hypothetical protein